jgi:predicted MPP superfamily phosphohydrolase
MWWFIIIWSFLLILVYYYIGLRLIKPLSLKKRDKKLLWILLILVPVSQPFSLMLRQLPTGDIFRIVLGWISYTGFGIFSLILAGLLIRDFFLLISFILKNVLAGIKKLQYPNKDRSVSFDPHRRLFLLNATNFSIIGFSAMMTGYGLYEASRQPRLEEVEIPIRGLHPDLDGFTIAQFSDLHASLTIRRHFIQAVVDQVNELKADVIVFTGDLVDGTVHDLRSDVAPLKELQAQHGVYFVTGNHEYYSGAEAWIEEVERLGMSVLLNENRLISYRQHSILLAGVTDYSSADFVSGHRSDPVKAIRTAENPAVKILLAHQPKSIFEAARAGFDLQLSGHTHGGQYFPWKYLVTLSQPYIQGLHRHGQTWIYVNRGAGYWGPPLRLGVPSEVTKITLTPA